MNKSKSLPYRAPTLVGRGREITPMQDVYYIRIMTDRRNFGGWSELGSKVSGGERGGGSAGESSFLRDAGQT